MSNVVILEELPEDRLLVKLGGSAEELEAAFSRFISCGVTLYHPKEIMDRHEEGTLACPDEKLEKVDLKLRRRQLAGLSGKKVGMVCLAKTVEDAVAVKMSI